MSTAFYSKLYSLIDAADICPETDEFFDEVVIAAVNMVDVADLRLTFGDETSQHHRSAGTQVRSLDLAAIELFDAFDDRGTAIDLDFCAHAF